GGKAGLRKIGQRLLLRVVEHAIVKVQKLLAGDIAVDRAADGADVACHAFAAAVVVHHHLQKVGVLRKFGEILFRAVDRAEAVLMPDVPAYADARLDRLHLGMQRGGSFTKAIVPELLPSQQLRVAENESPKFDVVAIRWAFAAVHELAERGEAGAHAGVVDAARFCLRLAVLAKAGEGIEIGGASEIRE